MKTDLLNKSEVSENGDIRIQKNVDLSVYTTMKIGGTAKYFTEANSHPDILKAYKWAKDNNLKLFPLGCGSNTIFSDTNHDYLFILIKNKGILKTYESSEIVNIEVNAGEDWDELVEWTTKNKLSGLECLSGIPGTVGAGPIQNIGAYGSEIKDTLSKVKILDLGNGEIFEISNIDCDFTYRDSIFKKNLGKFIILSVSFTLSRVFKDLPVPEYKDLQLHFLGKKQKKATAREVRSAILKIRSSKIPQPNEIPNSGSFFKNPIIENHLASRIARENPEIPYFKIDEKHTKLYAGWLIEKSGLKGFNFGKIEIDSKNALVIKNPGGVGNFEDLEKTVKQIQAQVFQKFEVELEIEPNIIR